MGNTSKATLVVRKLDPEKNANAYKKIAFGENLHRYACFFEAYSIEEAKHRIKQNTNRYENIYGLFLKNILVGSFIVTDVTELSGNSKKTAVVHYFIGERYWGNNYAYKGITILKEMLDFDILRFEIDKSNVSSICVQNKLDSTLVKTGPKYCYFELA